MDLRQRLISKKNRSQQKKIRVIFNKWKFDHISSILDDFLVLIPQELYVIKLGEFLKRCVFGFFPSSSIEKRWNQTMPKTFHKKRRLLHISRNKSAWRSLFYRSCEPYNVLRKTGHPFAALYLPHLKIFTKSDSNCLKQFLFRNQEFLHNICI